MLKRSMKVFTEREKEFRQLSTRDEPIKPSNTIELEKWITFLKNDIKRFGTNFEAIIGSFQAAKYSLVI